jgi:hypothetical protein
MQVGTEIRIGRETAPDELRPRERLEAIAAILARGVLRLRNRIPAESDASGLDSSAKTSLTGPRGLTR